AISPSNSRPTDALRARLAPCHPMPAHAPSPPSQRQTAGINGTRQWSISLPATPNEKSHRRQCYVLVIFEVIGASWSLLPVGVSCKGRDFHQTSNQAQQCLLFWSLSAAQELAELDVR